MNTYQQGKIYKIVSSKTDKIYIGSTTRKYLSSRLGDHFYRMIHQPSSNWTSFEILKLGDAEIVLVESYPCNNIDELHAREQYWIDTFRQICVNKMSATKEASLAKRNEKIECECGLWSAKTSISRHRRSEIHKSAMALKTQKIKIKLKKSINI